MHSSNFAHSWPPRTAPNSLDYSLQLYLQTHSITASKFTWSCPPSVSLWTQSIKVSTCNSKVARSWHSRASSHSLHHGVQGGPIMISKCLSPNFLDHSLQVHLRSFWIMSSQCIFKLAELRLPTISPNTLDSELHVYLHTHLIFGTECI